MTFGVISQGVVGGGFVELLLRGLVLGFIIRMFHSWYLKRSYSLWANIAYIFVAIRIYHTYRAGNGYLLYDVLYGLIPAYLIVMIIKHVFLNENKLIK